MVHGVLVVGGPVSLSFSHFFFLIVTFDLNWGQREDHLLKVMLLLRFQVQKWFGKVLIQAI